MILALMNKYSKSSDFAIIKKFGKMCLNFKKFKDNYMIRKPSKFCVHAFLWHLLCSLIMAALSSAVVFWIWHPGLLAKAVGVGHIFLMMLAVDVILGPLLTFAVAKQGKKSLKFDLSVIIFVQVAALIYGLHSIAANRPVYLAFDVWRFEIVRASDVRPEALKRAQSPYNHLSWFGPKWVAVKPATTTEDKNNRLFGELSTGISPGMQPDLYDSIENQWNVIVSEGAKLSDLKKFNPPEKVDAVIAKYPTADKFYPLKSFGTSMTVLINSKEKRILDLVDLRPWEE